MPLICIPNVSDGTRADTLSAMEQRLGTAGVHLLDRHSDAVHDRTVFTVSGEPRAMPEALTALAACAAELIDLTTQAGVHPRIGALDVCPFVPHDMTTMGTAIDAARTTAERIGREVGLPVYLYGEAATRVATRDLPALRRGGLARLAELAHSELPPDEGPRDIDPRKGVVCVGARDVLIAFNVWTDASLADATAIARDIRGPHLRALGFAMREGGSQVSMNLVAPQRLGIDDAFELVRRHCEMRRVTIRGTELVGLVPERFLPAPESEAARLMIQPSRSLESVLRTKT